MKAWGVSRSSKILGRETDEEVRKRSGQEVISKYYDQAYAHHLRLGKN